MTDEGRSREELIGELRALRRRIGELEAREFERGPRAPDGELFRQLVEHSLGLMCVHDLDGNLLFVNAAAARALGFLAEDGVGRNLRGFLAPSVEREFDAYLERIRANRVDSGLMRVTAKDGSERIWYYRNVRYQEPGLPPRVLGHAQDVTDRIRAEQALRESERRFRLLADTASVLVWMTDAAGSVTFLNQPWLAFTGRSLDQERGEGWTAGVHAEDRDRRRETGRIALETREPFRIEYRLRRADGEYRWMLDTGVPRVGTDGVFTGLVGSCVDVTESKRAAEALARAHDDLAALVEQRTAELVRTNAELREELRHRAEVEEERARARRIEALGGLAGGLAHEFNNLVTVISGRSQLLLQGWPGDAPGRGQVEVIDQTARRVAALTQQLLAFSRKQVLRLEPLRLDALVTGLVPTLARLLGAGIELSLHLDPGLGPVGADRGQLEQAIASLVENARDAMPAGGQLAVETASVELDQAFVQGHPGARPGPHARLTLRDTGVGMDADTRARLFEPFFTTKKPSGGKGLGLATVYGIVKQHGGYITAESEPGRGATFRIYLPADPAVDVASLRPGASPPSADAPRDVGTVLVVEDEDGVRQLVVEVLRRSGYTVLEARHPAEALVLGERHGGTIELLLTDVMLPQMTGPELAARLAAARPALRVLYMSGYAADTLGQRGVLGPGLAFVQKPFTLRVLKRKIEEALER